MRRILYLALAMLVVAIVLWGVGWSEEQKYVRLAEATPQVAIDPASGDVAAAIAELPGEVNPRTVALLRGRDDVVLIDVRRPEEYAGGHIPGSQLITLDTLAARAAELPSDKHVVLVCRSGNRSSEGVAILKGAGFGDVHSMDGGMRAWTKAGLESELEPSP